MLATKTGKRPKRKNIWICPICRMWEEAPASITTAPTCACGHRMTPDWPDYRISVDKYTHYAGNTLWEQLANKSMAAEANYNYFKYRY